MGSNSLRSFTAARRVDVEGSHPSLLPPGKLQADSAQRSALRWKTVSLNAVATAEILELMTGIEPVTSPLPRECSTN